MDYYVMLKFKTIPLKYLYQNVSTAVTASCKTQGSVGRDSYHDNNGSNLNINILQYLLKCFK